MAKLRRACDFPLVSLEERAVPLWLASEDLLLQHCFYTSTNCSSWSQCLRHQQGQLPSLALAKRTDRLVPEHAVCTGEVSVGEEGSRHCRSATGLNTQGCQSCVHAVRLEFQDLSAVQGYSKSCDLLSRATPTILCNSDQKLPQVDTTIPLLYRWAN